MKKMLQIVGEKGILLTRLDSVLIPPMADKMREWEAGRKLTLRIVDVSAGFHDSLEPGEMYDTANLLPPSTREAHLERVEYEITVSEGKKL